MLTKNKINVYLQYPWKFPDSSYYKNILDIPPKNINYVNYSTSKDKKIKIIGSSKNFQIMRKTKNFIRFILNIIKIPNILPTPSGNYDIIHCAHCLPLLPKTPWVIDTEVYNLIGDRGGSSKTIIKKLLLTKKCKKIIAWSEASKKSIIDTFPNEKEIIDKITILHFALPLPKFKKIRHKKIRILFIARWFCSKGGMQTLEVFDRLTKKYKNIECLYICDPPKELKEKYKKNKQIKIMGLIPQKRLFKEIYPSCDIFFYPGFGDSYGFTIQEAMAFELPIISTKTFAKDEQIEDKKTGFLVDVPKTWKPYFDMNEKLLQDLFEKTCILIDNKKLREKMGREGRRRIKSGKFSIEKRNKKLRKIYEDALKN